MDTRFRKLQRQFYNEPTIDTAQQYIGLLERLCGFGPSPELRPAKSKIGKLLRQQTEDGIDREAIYRQQLDEKFDELETLLLQSMHEHRPIVMGEDHLYVGSPLRYRFLGGEPPFRYKILRDVRGRKFFDEKSSLCEDVKKHLLSIGATLRPKDDSNNYHYGSSPAGRIVYDKVPSLSYYAISSLPGSDDALMAISLETDKEFVASLLKELLTE